MPIKKKLFNAPFVISLGSGAGKILSNIASSDLYYKIAVNSSDKDLHMIKSKVDEIIICGNGNGSGMDPQRGQEDLHKRSRQIFKLIDSVCEETGTEEIDMIPIIATLGHGFGSGSLPELISSLKKKYSNSLIIPFVVTPFNWEGNAVIQRAYDSLTALEVTPVVVSNEEVGTIFTDIGTSYDKINTLLGNLIQAIIQALTATDGVLQTVDKNDFSKFLQGDMATMRYMKLKNAEELTVDLILKKLDKRWFKTDMKKFSFGQMPEKLNVFYILDGKGPFSPKVLGEISEYLSKRDFVNQDNIKPLLIERKTKGCNFVWLESGFTLKCDKNIYGVF